MPRTLHVVAAVLEDADGRVLIAQRPPGKSFAGQWEFPGGKVDAGEGRFAGLVRELDEELGIQVEAARPLIRYRHAYPDLVVDLDAWRVTRWRGEPRGCEGQALAWHEPARLLHEGLLPADAVIVNALRLPPVMLVTPPAAPDGEGAFLDALEAYAASCRQAGPQSSPLICLRRPDLDAGALLELAAGAACRLDGTGARLLLHGDSAALAPLLRNPPAALRARLGDAVAGLHVPARSLPALSERPVPDDVWFGASCHGAAELEAAVRVRADYAFLGNVLPTASHPGQPGLGWDAFTAMVADLPLPVYAIGGLKPADLDNAWAAGAQGVAAIRGLWPSSAGR
ncbi:MAG: Nudix family hydrolase [Gammaproteobacteria bacterium]